MWLKVVPLLVERVLGAVIWDPSSGSYSFYHLSSLGVLHGFGLVLVVVLWEGGCDDCIRDAWREAIQEEAYGFFASDGIASVADEFFKVGYVLVDFWETHLASVEVKSSPLLVLGISEVLREFLDESVPCELDVVIYQI
jgi:hypothetical protein